MAAANQPYDPVGAMSGLFAPAYIAGDPQSEAAVTKWNQSNIPNYPGAPPPAAPTPQAAAAPAPAAANPAASASPYPFLSRSLTPIGGDTSQIVQQAMARRNAIAAGLMRR